MAYGILRVRNLSAGDIRSTEIHNERQYEINSIEKPENIDSDRSIFNESRTILRNTFDRRTGTVDVTEEDIDYKKEIEKRFKWAGVKPRKNSVQAIEFVLSASPEFFKNYDPSDFRRDSVEWLEKRYGQENVLTWSLHLDESTPHVHAIVTPIAEKEIKWKNRNGSGTKRENRLCARDITGGPDKLRQLQDDWFLHVSERYKDQAEWYRGTLVEKQLKEYTKQTNHEIGQLRNKLQEVQEVAEALAIKKEIEKKRQEMEEKTADLQKKIEIRKDRNRKDKWKKGNKLIHNEPLKRKDNNKSIDDDLER